MPKRIPETALRVRGHSAAARAWLGAAVLIGAGASAGCEERVSLGAWASIGGITSNAGARAGGNGGESGGGESGKGGEPTASGGEPSAAGAGGAEVATGGTSPIPDAAAPMPTLDEFPECLAVGVPGPSNTAGAEVGATEMFSYWTLPEAVDSLEWDFMVEREVPAREAGEPPIGGYYWHQQFSFVQGVAARFGIQAEGIYRSDPLAISETTKMAVLWLSGPPLEAELGDDFEYPDARVASETAGGVGWLTIHAKFDWQACTHYRFRFAPESTEADGNIWYGAWIDDVDAADSLFLGRMLLPPDVGLLSPFSISRSSPIDFGADTCALVPPVSALFGSPRSVDGAQLATLATNRFLDPGRCDTSQFTEFPTAVRHEVTE